MTIRQLVDDAIFLAEHGRYVGALTAVLAAVSGSSRKAFPQGTTPSRLAPKKQMGDKEAFTLFLGRRICELNGVRFTHPDSTASLLSLTIDGASQTIETILYKQFRCSLSHEGKLPATVEFKEERGFDLQDSSIKLSVTAGVVSLDQGWIGLLVRAVTHARCNSLEFGVLHHELRPKVGIDIAGLERELIETYRATPGRIAILKTFLEFSSPERVAAASANELNQMLQGALNGGALTGLVGIGLATRQGQGESALTAAGVAALRHLAAGYELVRVL